MDASSGGNEKAQKLRPFSIFLGLLPVLLSLVLVIGLWRFPFAVRVYEPPFLLPIFNTILFIASMVITYVAWRSYLFNGSTTILWLGCGVLALGTGALAAGWLLHPFGPNVNVTIFNISVLLAAVCHAGGLLASWGEKIGGVDPGRRRRHVILAYLAVLAVIALLVGLTLGGSMPPFFLKGLGSTALRQNVVVWSMALLIFASLVMMTRFHRQRSAFLYWYALALALLATAMLAFFLQAAVGSLIGWVGRSSYVFAAIYFLISVNAARREARSKGEDLRETIAELFGPEQYRALFDNLNDALVIDELLFDSQGKPCDWRILNVNPAYLKSTGRSRDEVIGRRLSDIYGIDRAPEPFLDNFAQVVQRGEPVQFEGYFEPLRQHLLISAFHLGGSRFATLLTDVTERKRAAEELQRSHDELEQRVAERTKELQESIAQLAEEVREREVAEEALRNSEEILKFSLKAADIGFWDLNLLDHTASRSLRHDQIFGYPELLPEWTYEMFLEHVLPEDRAEVHRKFQEALEARSEWGFECRIRRVDGEVRWIWAKGRGQVSDQGGPLRMLGLVGDITERKEAETSLLKEKTLLDKIINSLPAIFYLFDETGRFLRWNKNFEHVSGYPTKEFAQLKPLDFFEGEKKDFITKSIQDVFLKGENYIEADLRSKGGRKTPYFLTGNRIDLEGVPCLIGMGVDISDRKRAEEELRMAAQKWRTTFDSMRDAVLLVDREGQILQCNQATANLLKKPFSSVLGNFYWEVIYSKSAPIADCPFTRMRLSRRRETITWSTRDQWWQLIVDPILDEAGEVTGGVYNIADITLPKLSQDKIQDLNILLKAIKNINETLLRVKSEKELFQSTCDFLLAVPYIRFTWIGLVKPDSFDVTPVAWAGVEEGYLSTIKVTWDDSEFGRGPTGKGLRTKKPIISRNIAIDPSLTPWQQEALRRGYQSSATLPLTHNDEVVGILKVYSGLLDAFGNEEIDFLNQVAGDIAVGVKSLRLEQELVQNVIKLQIMMIQTVEAIGALQEVRDPYTAGHQRGVTKLACALGTDLGIEPDRIEGIRVAGLLHDIGKIVVPAEILNKPGKLNKTEMNIIKTHSEAGYDILKKISFPWPVAQIVLQHHERINGSGYPKGLVGQDILLEARILAVADVVEAMVSHRPYRPSLGVEKALDEVMKNRDTLYDPDVADTCLKLFKEKGFNFS